ncbi:MAG: Rqc2 family fibronectin-binding protein [Bacillota bacterium]|jgi:predicted ribosome quality control (RQC) complex YloA/Tae2 family protein
MAFDSFITAAVTQQLQQHIIGAKIVKIHQPDRHSIILRFYGPSDTGKLLISAHPQNPRIHLIEKTGENPLQPPLFCMVLRKYLEGGKVTAVRQKGLERIVEIDFAIRNDLGDATICRLVIEIMGKHSNIILLNEKNIIIDGIRRYSHQLSRYREVLPGQTYLAPPPQHKKIISSWDEEQLAQAMWQLPIDLTVKEALSRLAEGFSPLMVQEVLKRAGLEQNLPISQLGQYEIRKLNQSLDQIYDIYYKKAFAPVIRYQQHKALDFAAFPLLLWQGEEERFDDISHMLEKFYTQKSTQELFQAKKRELLKIISTHYSRISKKIILQQRDLAQSEAGDRYKEAGDLLSAHLYSLEKGLSNIELESFYEPGKFISIELKPELSPQENCQRYYRLYNKCKKSHKLIQEQLTASLEEEAYIASVLLNAEQSASLAELQDIREELAAGGYIKEAKAPKNKDRPLPPRSFTSRDGLTILVGRNNRQNDKLTLKMAAKNDIWLHAQKIPGSHVIIRSGGQPVPLSTLKQAASLAAWYSKAQKSSNVPVDYTSVDQVKKPHGAKPGMVIYYQQKTLYVDPEEPQE